MPRRKPNRSSSISPADRRQNRRRCRIRWPSCWNDSPSCRRAWRANFGYVEQIVQGADRKFRASAKNCLRPPAAAHRGALPANAALRFRGERHSNSKGRLTHQESGQTIIAVSGFLPISVRRSRVKKLLTGLPKRTISRPRRRRRAQASVETQNQAFAADFGHDAGQEPGETGERPVSLFLIVG